MRLLSYAMLGYVMFIMGQMLLARMGALSHSFAVNKKYVNIPWF